MTIPPWSVPAALGALAAVLLAWNLAIGVRATSLGSAGTAFRALTGLGAFLLLPALLIGVLAPTEPGARVLTPLTWFWPLVTLGVVVQAAWAFARRRSSSLHAIPVVLFDVLVAWIAIARWLEALGAGLPAWLLAPGVAVSALGASALGEGAYLWSAWLLLPSLVPAAPARSTLSAAWRAAVAAGFSVLLVLVGAGVPRAFAGLQAARAIGEGLMTERARGDLAVGLHLLGDVTAPPAPAAARHDAALADSLGASAVHVTITPEGGTAAVLDSVARVLEGRRDSVTLVVSLALADDEAATLGANDAHWLPGRIALVERVVKRLHPDVLLPAGDHAPYGSAARWEDYYERVARAARRIDRDVTIALATSAATPLDSTLCDWVGQGDTPVDAIALAVPPGRDGPARLRAAQAALGRWLSMAHTPPVVWVVALPSAPAVDGEVAQQHVLRQALQWASAHAWVRGVIAGDASDTWWSGGLRAASGRSRPALAEVGNALRSLRDSPALPVTPSDTASADSTRHAALPPSPARP
ncbi:MAG: hypothetical protein ACYC3L_06330 [Gemmatimonadaceae bacterium]